MTKESINQEFRLKNIKEKRNYFIKEINQNDLMRNKYRKVCTALSYIELFLNLAFKVTGHTSISAFTYLVHIPMRNMSSTIGLNICAITARIKKYKSIYKKKKKRHDEITLFAKTKSNIIKRLNF